MQWRSTTLAEPESVASQPLEPGSVVLPAGAEASIKKAQRKAQWIMAQVQEIQAGVSALTNIAKPIIRAAHAELDQLLANVEGMQAMEAQLVDVQCQLRKWQKCHRGLQVLVSQQEDFGRRVRELLASKLAGCCISELQGEVREAHARLSGLGGDSDFEYCTGCDEWRRSICLITEDLRAIRQKCPRPAELGAYNTPRSGSRSREASVGGGSPYQ
ncbi:unnamed protein product [Symbiodinium sp. CCMP2592]|nr:unnamed protein product [Symbiodinium sp. CCMP2592]